MGGALSIEKVSLKLQDPNECQPDSLYGHVIFSTRENRLSVCPVALTFPESDNQRLRRKADKLNQELRQAQWTIETLLGCCSPVLSKELAQFEFPYLKRRNWNEMEELFNSKVSKFIKQSRENGEHSAEEAREETESDAFPFIYDLTMQAPMKQCYEGHVFSVHPMNPGISQLKVNRVQEWTSQEIYDFASYLMSTRRYREAEQLINFALIFRTPTDRLLVKLMLLRVSLLVLQNKKDIANEWMKVPFELQYFPDVEHEVRSLYLQAITGTEGLRSELLATIVHMNDPVLRLGFTLALAVDIFKPRIDPEDGIIGPEDAINDDNKSVLESIREQLRWCLTAWGIQPAEKVLCRLLLAEHPNCEYAKSFRYYQLAGEELLRMDQVPESLAKIYCQSFKLAIYDPYLRDLRDLQHHVIAQAKVDRPELRSYAASAFDTQSKLYSILGYQKKSKNAHDHAIACYYRIRRDYQNTQQTFHP